MHSTGSPTSSNSCNFCFGADWSLCPIYVQARRQSSLIAVRSITSNQGEWYGARAKVTDSTGANQYPFDCPNMKKGYPTKLRKSSRMDDLLKTARPLENHRPRKRYRTAFLMATNDNCKRRGPFHQFTAKVTNKASHRPWTTDNRGVL